MNAPEMYRGSIECNALLCAFEAQGACLTSTIPHADLVENGEKAREREREHENFRLPEARNVRSEFICVVRRTQGAF